MKIVEQKCDDWQNRYNPGNQQPKGKKYHTFVGNKFTTEKLKNNFLGQELDKLLELALRQQSILLSLFIQNLGPRESS